MKNKDKNNLDLYDMNGAFIITWECGVGEEQQNLL